MPSFFPASWFTKPEPPLSRPSPPTGTLGTMIKKDLKEYIVEPVDKVMNDPTRALFYSAAIKMISLFVALVFPFIGYTAIGLSLALIDRVILLNFRDFTATLIDRINVDCIQSLIRAILGSPEPEQLTT